MSESRLSDSFSKLFNLGGLLSRQTRRKPLLSANPLTLSIAFSVMVGTLATQSTPALADFASTAPPAPSSYGAPTNTATYASNTAAPGAPLNPTGANGQSGEIPQQAATSRLPIGANYKIHSGDQLSVQVYGDQSLSQTTTVLPDGSINYPLVGRVAVRGSSTEQAAATITRRLQSFVRHPYVTVTIASPAQFTILVLGNVKLPGKYFLRSDARVTDAIAAAGGLAPTNGNLPNARISLGAKNVEQVNLQQLFHDGDTSQNKALEDGSVVYIPNPNTFDVEVVGSVDHPGNVTLNEGDKLSMAIAKAGNSQNSNADLNHVHITRVGPDGKGKSIEVNLYNTLLKGDINADVPLYKGDVVYVPISKNGAKTGSGVGGTLFLFRRLLGVPF